MLFEDKLKKHEKNKIAEAELANNSDLLIVLLRTVHLKANRLMLILATTVKSNMIRV
jgi:hypothetical protein